MTDIEPDIEQRLRMRVDDAERESRFGDAEDMLEAANEIARLRGLLREATPYIEGAQNTTSVDALLATEELLKRVGA